jgi:hypothetical protein
MTYSYRNATVGSRFIARRVGSKHASAAKATRIATVDISVTESVGVVCTRTVVSNRPIPTAPARPRMRPKASCTTIRRTTSHTICRGWAPSARRTPISEVRCVTE